MWGRPSFMLQESSSLGTHGARQSNPCQSKHIVSWFTDANFSHERPREYARALLTYIYWRSPHESGMGYEEISDMKAEEGSRECEIAERDGSKRVASG